MKINIGSSATYIPGYVNIDKVSWCDTRVDLDRERLPFNDGDVEVVFTYHTLEHFQNYLHVMREIWRVCCHGAIVMVGVPYISSTRYNLVNPYHHTHFNEYSFDFFDNMRGTAAEDTTIHFKKLACRINFFPDWKDRSDKYKEHGLRHYFNVAESIDFVLSAVKYPKLKHVTMEQKTALALFDSALSLRTPYRLGK